jgi:hypothetical protein
VKSDLPEDPDRNQYERDMVGIKAREKLRIKSEKNRPDEKRDGAQ